MFELLIAPSTVSFTSALREAVQFEIEWATMELAVPTAHFELESEPAAKLLTAPVTFTKPVYCPLTATLVIEGAEMVPPFHAPALTDAIGAEENTLPLLTVPTVTLEGVLPPRVMTPFSVARTIEPIAPLGELRLPVSVVLWPLIA